MQLRLESMMHNEVNITALQKAVNKLQGDVEKLIAETSKIMRYIDWEPKYNDLNEIINSSIKWEEKINASNI